MYIECFGIRKMIQNVHDTVRGREPGKDNKTNVSEYLSSIYIIVSLSITQNSYPIKWLRFHWNNNNYIKTNWIKSWRFQERKKQKLSLLKAWKSSWFIFLIKYVKHTGSSNDWFSECNEKSLIFRLNNDSTLCDLCE